MRNTFFIIKTELKKIFRNRFTRLALAAILLIPLLYGFLYLWAFWDPYGNLEGMPVAVVNLDAGATYNGEYKNAGNDIIEKLQSEQNLSWQFTTQDDASKGLEEKRYYAIITIPEDFTSKILTIKDPEPVKAEIFYESDDSVNFLGDKISFEAAKNIHKEIIANITEEYSDEIVKLKDEIASNFSTGVDSIEELSDGMILLTQGAVDLKYGVSDAHDGSKDLQDALKNLSEGAETLSDANAAIATSTQTIVFGIHSAYQLAQLKCADPTLLATLANLDNGTQKLNASEQVISRNSLKLSKGLDKAYSGSKELSSGLEDIEDGTIKLKEGISKAAQGSEELYSGLSDSQSMISDYDADRLAKIVEMQHEPVILYEITGDKSPNYGTALSPYFIQLALFVGALLLLMLLKPKNLALNTSECSTAEISIGMFIVAAIFGAIQAIILDLALIVFLGFEVQSLIGLILFTILVSWTFIAIIQFLMFTFGKVGQLLSIVLLMLQLTSAAGTFPIESAPKFFQAVHPLMPMTHGMDALRDIVFKGVTHIVYVEAIILSAIIIGFIVLKMICTRRKAAYRDIHPRFEF